MIAEKLKIGILGSRGIPNNYGGFEQFSEMLSVELNIRGHELSVYCPDDHPFKEQKFKGVNRIICSNPEKSMGTVGQFLYDLNCILDSRKRQFDVLLLLGYTSSAIWSFLLPKKSLIVSNMDGLEWKRSKYSNIVQRFLKFSERLAAKSSDVLIADSLGIQEHLKTTYKLNSQFIPYSAEINNTFDKSVLEEWGLEAKAYDLVIARMEPENNIESICEAYRKQSVRKLIIIGNAQKGFGLKMKSEFSSENISFVGGVYDQSKLNSLRYFSKTYLHGHSVGGTNPSLLEAMASSCSIVAHKNLFNEAVLGPDARYFENALDLTGIINKALEPDLETIQIENNLEKIKTLYSPKSVADAYENLFYKTLS